MAPPQPWKEKAGIFPQKDMSNYSAFIAIKMKSTRFLYQQWYKTTENRCLKLQQSGTNMRWEHKTLCMSTSWPNEKDRVINEGSLMQYQHHICLILQQHVEAKPIVTYTWWVIWYYKLRWCCVVKPDKKVKFLITMTYHFDHTQL